jgi:hypothetical protein
MRPRKVLAKCNCRPEGEGGGVDIGLFDEFGVSYAMNPSSECSM